MISRATRAYSPKRLRIGPCGGTSSGEFWLAASIYAFQRVTSSLELAKLPGGAEHQNRISHPPSGSEMPTTENSQFCPDHETRFLPLTLALALALAVLNSPERHEGVHSRLRECRRSNPTLALMLVSLRGK